MSEHQDDAKHHQEGPSEVRPRRERWRHLLQMWCTGREIWWRIDSRIAADRLYSWLQVHISIHFSLKYYSSNMTHIEWLIMEF